MRADYNSIADSAKTPLLHKDDASSKSRFSFLIIGSLLVTAALGTFAIQHIATRDRAPLSEPPTHHVSATRLSDNDSRLGASPFEESAEDSAEHLRDDDEEDQVSLYPKLPSVDMEQAASLAHFEQQRHEKLFTQLLFDKADLDPTATEQDHAALIERHAEAHFEKLRKQQESDRKVMSHFESIGRLGPLAPLDADDNVAADRKPRLGWKKYANWGTEISGGWGTVKGVVDGTCNYACEKDKVEDAAGGGFCWKDAYGRGVGKIPSKCPSNKDKIGALCYNECKNDYKRVGVDCHQKCKSGWTDHGLLCYNSKSTYFAGSKWESCKWKKWKHVCSCPGGWNKCGPMCYAKCKSGYGSPGTCNDFCQMSCSGQGYAHGVAPSCPKKTELSPGVSGMSCDSGEEMDAGLCYPKCGDGYKGVGPVCWIDKFKLGKVNFVQCGLAFALDTDTCALTTTDQVVSALEALYCCGTMILAPPGQCWMDKPKDIEGKYKMAKFAIQTLLDAGVAGEGAVEPIMDCINDECDLEDMAKMILGFLSVVDPTGISGAASAFWHPKCNDMRKEYNENI